MPILKGHGMPQELWSEDNKHACICRIKMNQNFTLMAHLSHTSNEYNYYGKLEYEELQLCFAQCWSRHYCSLILQYFCRTALHRIYSTQAHRRQIPHVSRWCHFVEMFRSEFKFFNLVLLSIGHLLPVHMSVCLPTVYTTLKLN